MKANREYILTRLCLTVVLAGLVFMAWGQAAYSISSRTQEKVFTRPADNDAEASSTANRDAPDENELSVATSGLRFNISYTGRWLGLYPAWAGGRTVFIEGGFFITAAGPDGQWLLLEANLDQSDRSFQPQYTLEHLGFGRSWEGQQGGNRAPTVNPDDDRDGRIDEDPFDGLDNDDDGSVDEDFAAIGDDMVVLEYQAAGPRGEKLNFHQETSAWSLPHINGLVAVQLTVTNTGREPLSHVRVGACIRKDGPFALTRRQLTNRAGDRAPAEQAEALIWTQPQGAAVGLLCPVQPVGMTSSEAWMLWSVNAGEPVTAILKSLIHPEQETGSAAPRQTARTGFESTGLDRITYEKNVLAGALSPDLGVLEPGGSRRITVLVAATPKQEDLDRALNLAHRTWLGDGANRLLPPVVPVTPYLVWGSYERAEYPDNGLIIRFEPSQHQSFDPSRLTFMGGIDRGDLEFTGPDGGPSRLLIRGESAERLLRQGGERILLKGRDHTGAFFDAMVRPAEDNLSVPASAAADVEQYWQSAGKLPEMLLSGSPNPFRGQTTVFYEVPAVIETEDGGEVRFDGTVETSVKVYDVTGRLVSILVDESNGPGRYQIGWQAADDNGSGVASGVYYIKLQLGKRHITKRFILLK